MAGITSSSQTVDRSTLVPYQARNRSVRLKRNKRFSWRRLGFGSRSVRLPRTVGLTPYQRGALPRALRPVRLLSNRSTNSLSSLLWEVYLHPSMYTSQSLREALNWIAHLIGHVSSISVSCLRLGLSLLRLTTLPSISHVSLPNLLADCFRASTILRESV
nr:MAG: hypothetical protein [Eriocheir sinensis permutotetra-like virus]